MKLTRLALIPVAALLLSACGDDDAPIAEAPTESVAEAAPATSEPEAPATVTVTQEAAEPEATTEEPEAEAEATEEPEPEAAPAEEGGAENEITEGEGKFGDTWVYDDGIEVMVAAGEKFTPSDTSAGGEGFDDFVKFTITLTNNSGESFDPSSTYSTVQSGTSEGDQVFDSAADIAGSPSTTLLDGRSVSYDIVFGVEDPDDLVMEISPSFDYDAAIFTS